MSGTTIRHELPGVHTPKADWEMKRKCDVWQFVGETISACGSEAYPWNPEVVKAIREFEPDFCPVWVTTAYLAPTGGISVFGRHAIAIDCQNHVQEGKHRPVRVLTTPYGINAGRRPILVEEIIQNEDVQMIPDLKVFGYAPMDWGFYHKARRSWYEEKKKREQAMEDPEADKAAEAFIAARDEAKAKGQAAENAEADYRFDFVSNKGKKIRDAILGLTFAEARQLGIR